MCVLAVSGGRRVCAGLGQTLPPRLFEQLIDCRGQVGGVVSLGTPKVETNRAELGGRNAFDELEVVSCGKVRNDAAQDWCRISVQKKAMCADRVWPLTGTNLRRSAVSAGNCDHTCPKWYNGLKRSALAAWAKSGGAGELHSKSTSPMLSIPHDPFAVDG